MRILVCILACISVGTTGYSNPSVYKVEDNIEEYFVEHSISSLQAKNAVQQTDLKFVEPKAGCQQCTSQEIRYCLGLHLVNDHCCCDKRYSEFFPYVPHTCYMGKKLCKPVAKDCAEYTRLRTCCCDKYVLEKWKLMTSGSNCNEAFKHLILIILSLYLLL